MTFIYVFFGCDFFVFFLHYKSFTGTFFTKLYFGLQNQSVFQITFIFHKETTESKRQCCIYLLKKIYKITYE